MRGARIKRRRKFAVNAVAPGCCSSEAFARQRGGLRRGALKIDHQVARIVAIALLSGDLAGDGRFTAGAPDRFPDVLR
jgi:hypothetical protein